MNNGMASKKRRIPFTYKQHEPGQWVVFDADGKPVAVCPGNERLIDFIVVACNNYTALKQIARLSRGEIECDESPYGGAARQAMRELFGRLDCTVLHG